MKQLVVLAVGNEITEGKIADTNSAWLSARLSRHGFFTREHRALPDDHETLIRTFRDLAAAGTDLVVITGGLGPTVDDITRECLAEACGSELVFDAHAWDMLVERFRGFGRVPGDNNRQQAFIPAGAVPFYNTCGTAPGFGIVSGRTRFAVMPGIPREMKAMYAESLELFIAAQFGVGQPFKESIFRTLGIGESDLGRLLADLMTRGRDPRVDLTVQDGVITIKLAGSPGLDEAAMERSREAIRDRAGTYIWTDRDEDLAGHIVRLLADRELTLALAESCTGGLAAAGLVAVPGCSDVLIESIVAYANQSKTARLGVTSELLEQHGAVSEAVVLEMARGVRRSSGADIGAAITGIAGPDGGTPAKPVGTVWFAVCGPGGEAVLTRCFPGDREYVRLRSAAAIYGMIREHVITL